MGKYGGHGGVKDAMPDSRATNSNATKPQTERGNQRSMKNASASGRYPESSKGAFRGHPSPSPSMSHGGGFRETANVGSKRDDMCKPVMNHNPYPNGIA